MSNWQPISCSECPNVTLAIIATKRGKRVLKYCGLNGGFIENPKKVQQWCPLDDTEGIRDISINMWNYGKK